MFGMISVFAEFERATIQERVRAGLVRARAQGKRLGRPRIDAKMEQRIRAALAKGDRGILRIAGDLGVGSGTVQRVKAALSDAA
jgi:DNA invertase Pin-like site-specific DNA recombinase